MHEICGRVSDRDSPCGNTLEILPSTLALILGLALILLLLLLLLLLLILTPGALRQLPALHQPRVCCQATSGARRRAHPARRRQTLNLVGRQRTRSFHGPSAPGRGAQQKRWYSHEHEHGYEHECEHEHDLARPVVRRYDMIR